MPVLIGNTVKTEYADYPCATREEAETLFMTLREREERRHAQEAAAASRPAGTQRKNAPRE